MEDKSMHIRESSDEKPKKHQLIIEKYDRISSLHDSILHRILSFLPTKMAVQTTILSKRWQKLCASLPYIDLEEHRETHKESFMNFVDNFLFHHDKSSKIIRFRLSGEKAYDVSHINAWISDAVEGGVEELDLYHRPLPLTSDKLTLTSCLFRCNTLVELKLDLGYEILFPKYFCFTKMKAMHLSRIIFPENFIDLLQYNSPNLEKLFLEFCSVHTNSPSSLHAFQDLIANDNSLGNFSHLKDVYMGFSPCRRGSHFVGKFVRCLYNVEALHLPRSSISLFTFESYFLDHLPTFYNLKRLELTINTMVDQLGVMACMLRCSPILESLHIVFFNLMWNHESELKPDEFPSLCVPATATTLKWIRIDHFRATKNQLELVRLFLGTSRFLEKLIVQVDKYGEKHPLQDNCPFFPVDDRVIDLTSSCQELSQLPRLSTNCVLQIF